MADLSMDVCGIRAAMLFDANKLYTGRAIREAICRAASGQYSAAKPARLSLTDEKGADYTKSFANEKKPEKPHQSESSALVGELISGLIVGAFGGAVKQ